MHSLFHHSAPNNDETNPKEVHENNKLSYSGERFSLDKCVTSYVVSDTFPSGSSGCSEEISALKRSLKSKFDETPPAIVRSPVLGRSA